MWPFAAALAEGGCKPPHAALAEDRRGERCGKGARDASGGDREDGAQSSFSGIAVDVSLLNKVTSKPGCSRSARDESGGCPRFWPGGVRHVGDVSPVCCFCAERGESAGINRHEERDENARHRRSSDPRWPRVMRWRPARAQRSVDRGTCRPAIEPRNHCFGVPTSSHEAEGHTAGGVSASRPVDPARSENLCMYGVLMRENREIPLLARPVDRWVGRPGNVEAVSLG